MMAGLIHGSERATRLLAALVVMSALSTPGCTRTDSASAPGTLADELTPATSAFRATLNDLTRLSSNETGEPIDLAPPASLAQLKAPEAWDPARAMTPFDEAIRLSNEGALERFTPIDPEAPNELARNAALRLYVGARMALNEGNVREAVTDLESAVRLDPGASRLWEVLGEAHSASGNRMAATIAMRRAAEAGTERARTWLAIAVDAQGRAQHEDAIFYTSRALELTGPRQDTAAWVLGNVTQGQSLHARGYLAAGNEALREGLETPIASGSAGRRLRAELAAVERARPTLWTTIGDADTRLGRYDQADQAYRMADELNSAESADVITRRLYVALRAGRPATAGRLMLDGIDRRDGRVVESDVARARFLRANAPEIASQVADALADGADIDASSSELARRVRVRAAASDPSDARDLLATGLRAHPSDEGLIRDLIEASTDLPTEDLLTTIGGLGATLPLHTDLLAERLLASGLDHETLDQAGAGNESPGVPALHARLLAGMDRASDGLARLGTIDASRTLDVLLTAGEIGAGAGAWQTVADATSAIESLETTDALVALARVNGAAQQQAATARTLDRLDGLEAQLDARSMIRLAALANGVGDVDGADSWLGYATETDPALEQIYVAIIELHGENGPAPDAELFRGAISALRENVPDSRAITLLRIREAMSTGNFGLAQRELLAITEAHPTDRGAADLLVALWTQIAPNADELTIEKALEWIDGRGEQPGWQAWAAGAKSRMLMASGDPDSAESLLNEAIDTTASLDLQKQRVGLLAVTGRGAEAGPELVALLRNAPPTIDNTVDLAGAHLAMGQLSPAQDALDDRLPEGAMLTPSQADRLANSLVRAQAMLPGDRQAQVLRFAERLVDMSDTVPGSLHRVRVLLALNVGTAQEVINAVTDATRAGLIQPLRDQLLNQTVTEDDSVSEDDRAQSDLLYLAAIQFARRGDDENAIRLYERTIELAPRFAMAHNNLGYTLVEQGVRLDDAAGHLETAYEEMPDDPSIIDSLGWLRYRQGMIADDGDRRGALWLLTKASQTEEGRSNETILDHLGDALWRAGQTDEAILRWKDALESLERSVKLAQQNNDDEMRRSLDEDRDRILAKVTNARNGKEPRVAPLFDGVTRSSVGMPEPETEPGSEP